jgi:outer membrane protein TolC
MEYEQFYQHLLFEAIELYIDALKKKAVHEIAQTNETASLFNYEYALSKNRQGTLSDIDLLNAEADYDNSLYESRKGKLDADIALSTLRRKLNSSDLTIEDITMDNPAYIKIQDFTTKDTENLPSTSPDIRIQEKNMSILSLNKIIAQRNRWLPQLNVGLSLTYDEYTYTSLTQEWSQMDPKIDPAVTITATIPLFSNNEKRIAVKKSAMAMEKARIALEESKSEFIESLTELVELHNRSVDLLNISNKRVQSAKREYELKNESFKLGITTMLELYDTRDRYMERQKEALFFALDIILLRARIGNVWGDTFYFIEESRGSGTNGVE